MARFQRPYRFDRGIVRNRVGRPKVHVQCWTRFGGGCRNGLLHKYGLAHPAWLSLASTKMMCELLSKTAAAGCGQSSGVTNRHGQDMIHSTGGPQFWRSAKVANAFEKKSPVLRALPGRRAHDVRRRYKKLLDHIGSRDLQAFPIASDMLAPTAAHGGADAIKRSFRKVEADLKNPLKAVRIAFWIVILRKRPEQLPKLGKPRYESRPFSSPDR